MVGRAGFEVEEPSGPRWDLALELLADRDSPETVFYRGLGLWLDRDHDGRATDGLLTVAVQSSWQLSRITETTATEDLERARAIVDNLLETDPRFVQLIGERRVQYLLLDDYGMGAIHVCTLSGDTLRWEAGFPQAS
jgi:hypothetical protein